MIFLKICKRGGINRWKIQPLQRWKAFILKAFYGLLNKFGFLGFSLYSCLFQFFFSRWLDHFLFINWFLTFLFSSSFSLKAAAIKVVELIFEALVYLLNRFGFSFLFCFCFFGFFQIWMLFAFFVFYKFQHKFRLLIYLRFQFWKLFITHWTIFINTSLGL